MEDKDKKGQGDAPAAEDKKPDDVVERVVQRIAEDESLKKRIEDAVKSAVEGAIPGDKTKGQKSIREIVYAAIGESSQKREIRNPIGAMVVAAYHGRGDYERAAEYSRLRWGEGNPVERQFKVMAVKALTSGTTGGAAEMVQETIASEVIEALRPASVVRSSGAQIVPNPTGTLHIPRIATGVSVTWVGEAAASNATQQVTDTVTLTRKKAMVKVPITKELIQFATPDAEQAIADDVVAAMAAGTDLAYIRGSGGSTPTGVRNQVAGSNVFVSGGTTAADVENDISTLLGAVRGANVPLTPDTGVFWMNTRTLTFLEKLRDSNGNLIYPELRLDQPRIHRYRVMVTNNIPNNLTTSGVSPTGVDSEIYFGRGPSILIADAREMELEVLENVAYTNSSGAIESGVDKDTVLVKATLLTDLALRHTTSWAVMTGVQYGS